MCFMSFFVASFYACQVLSNPRICRSFVAYFHITQWMVLAKLFQIVGPIFVPRILQLLGLAFWNICLSHQIQQPILKQHIHGFFDQLVQVLQVLQFLLLFFHQKPNLIYNSEFIVGSGEQGKFIVFSLGT